MNTSTRAILLETIGLALFIFLCNSRWDIPTSVLVGFLFCLQAGLIWMTILILKDVHAEKNRKDDVTFQ